MIDVLNALDRVFVLSGPRKKLLAAALIGGRVRFPSTGLQLPLGVGQDKIDGYYRDLADFGSDGILRLKQQVATAEEGGEVKVAATLRRSIANAPKKYDAAEEALAAALGLRQRREEALAAWLSWGLSPAEMRTLAGCLRHNVTYLCYHEPRLYFEFD